MLQRIEVALDNQATWTAFIQSASSDADEFSEFHDATLSITDGAYFDVVPVNIGLEEMDPFEQAFSFHALRNLVPDQVLAPAPIAAPDGNAFNISIAASARNASNISTLVAAADATNGSFTSLPIPVPGLATAQAPIAAPVAANAFRTSPTTNTGPVPVPTLASTAGPIPAARPPPHCHVHLRQSSWKRSCVWCFGLATRGPPLFRPPRLLHEHGHPGLGRGTPRQGRVYLLRQVLPRCSGCEHRVR